MFLQYKSWTGGQGLVEDITWEDITLVNVSTGIFVTQKCVVFVATLLILADGWSEYSYYDQVN